MARTLTALYFVDVQGAMEADSTAERMHQMVTACALSEEQTRAAVGWVLEASHAQKPFRHCCLRPDGSVLLLSPPPPHSHPAPSTL